MWIKSENDSTMCPAEVERSGNYIIVRKGFRLVEATEERPAHYEYDEWQMTADQYEVYQDAQKQLDISEAKVKKLTDVLMEFGQMVADIDGEDLLAPIIKLYPEWETDHEYVIDDRVRYGEKAYKCVQAHTSQNGWEPPHVPALWTEIAAKGEIPVWKQPTGAQDAYMTGDKVWYPDQNGDIWISTADNNVWQPGVYGWEKEVAE